jgi:hypothetical protein
MSSIKVFLFSAVAVAVVISAASTSSLPSREKQIFGKLL